jgi:hypothetical protein
MEKDLPFNTESKSSVMKTLLSCVLGLAIASLSSCGKFNEFNQSPELAPLEHGFRTSATIGYCASLVQSAFNGDVLPANVEFDPQTKSGFTGAGILHVTVDQANPLPFNSHTGKVHIASLWNGHSGVISILFADFDVIESNIKFYGLYTAPIFRDILTGDLKVIFVEQDVLVGEGQDTLINLSLSKPKFDAILADPVYEDNPLLHDPFVAVKQNVWHITVKQNGTPSDFYDDLFRVTGGGQIVEAASLSGGLLYHAMIEVDFSFSNCNLNPTSGIAFIQNLKAGSSSIDLGNITLDFHSECDGQAKVVVATGKYLTSNGKEVTLGWN